ncbi:hypothetical protein ACHAW5_005758 [Stephanodiscus triporus]|uniref:Rab-GAP TBC domain-containing protein n=1 Tax=Stephanodiscus triporus TaxID=2934178 RepID=A0ABD3NT19_9STRA
MNVAATLMQLRAVAFPPLPGGETDDGAAAVADPVVFPRSATATAAVDVVDDDVAVAVAPRTYRERRFDAILSSPVASLRELRKLAWNGVPQHMRPTTWKILLGYLPANASRREGAMRRRREEYRDAVRRHYDVPDDSRTYAEQETLRQVLVDVPRTAPDVPLFRDPRVRRCLGRLLYVWATRHPASGYVQGINDLATPLLAVFVGECLGDVVDGDGMADVLDGSRMVDVTDRMMEDVEADAYWCLTSLLSGIQDHYTSDQPGMQRMVMRLEELVNRIDAELASHLRDTGIEFMQFAFKWMNCLLLREFRLPCVMRLWDAYFSEGDGGFEDFHVYVCASFLVHFSPTLRQMGFDELFQFMQNMPTDDWGDREVEILLSSAFVLSTLFGGSEAHLNVVRH